MRNTPQRDRRTGGEAPLPPHEKRRRKQRLLTHGIPSMARSIAHALIIKDEDLFFVADRDGSVALGGHHGFGLYYHDCRFLSGYCLTLQGQDPEPLAASAGAGFGALLELTNPDLRLSPAEVIPSNPGHALWAGIADLDKARNTMERLMRSDMFTGRGIRTLSSGERRYNPIGYHLGTVWPHDNAIIAAGFRRYGCDEAASRVFAAILDASIHFPNSRLPEVFSGFSRSAYGSPVRYPVACHPQAWAAGAVPFLLQSALGLKAEGFENRLTIVRPVLPDMVRWADVRRLHVGPAQTDLRFECQADGGVTVEVLETSGDLEVRVEPASAEGRGTQLLPKEKKVA